MNTQRSRIACIAGAILLIVGIVAFITHDRDSPVEQVRVYELPETDTDGTGKTETLVSGQPTWRSDNNAAVESDELDSRVDNTFHEKIEQYLEEHGLSMSEFMRTSVEQMFAQPQTNGRH